MSRAGRRPTKAKTHMLKDTNLAGLLKPADGVNFTATKGGAQGGGGVFWFCPGLRRPWLEVAPPVTHSRPRDGVGLSGV